MRVFFVCVYDCVLKQTWSSHASSVHAREPKSDGTILRRIQQLWQHNLGHHAQGTTSACTQVRRLKLGTCVCVCLAKLFLFHHFGRLGPRQHLGIDRIGSHDIRKISCNAMCDPVSENPDQPLCMSRKIVFFSLNVGWAAYLLSDTHSSLSQIRCAEKKCCFN